jgi:hypothetical protein
MSSLRFELPAGAQVIQDEVLEVGSSYQMAAGGGRKKAGLEPQQREELQALMTELCKMEQEVECRKKALGVVSQHADNADPGAMYKQELAKETEKQKSLAKMGYMKQFEKSFGAGSAAAAGDDSDDDMEVQGGGDEDKQYKCPISGFFEWLENPVRPAGCNGNRACVFSKKNMEAHIKRGPNAGHQFARCPIQGCNAFIKSLQELELDRDMVKQVKQAKRSAERREAAEMEDDDAVDMTQG